MIRILREVITKEKSEQKERFAYSQASFNSDGCITLRNYNNDRDDEIIILTHDETHAILKLFSKLGTMNKNYNLPF